MGTPTTRQQRKNATEFRTTNGVAIKRYANSEMFQVIRAFDDFAAVVG